MHVEQFNCNPERMLHKVSFFKHKLFKVIFVKGSCVFSILNKPTKFVFGRLKIKIMFFLGAKLFVDILNIFFHGIQTQRHNHQRFIKFCQVLLFCKNYGNCVTFVSNWMVYDQWNGCKWRHLYDLSLSWGRSLYLNDSWSQYACSIFTVW